MQWFSSITREIIVSQNDTLKQNNLFLQQRVAFLEAELLRLKREGFQRMPGAEEAPPPMFPGLPKTILEAVAQRAVPGSAGEAELLLFARQQMDLEVDPESIADHILRGAEGL